MIATDALMRSSSRADAKVVWTHGESHDAVKVASMVTGNTSQVFNHIQGPCCNAEMNYHQVESCADTVIANGNAASKEMNFRASVTYRAVLFPDFCWTSYVKKQVENGFTKEAYGSDNANSHIHRSKCDTKGVFSGNITTVSDIVCVIVLQFQPRPPTSRNLVTKLSKLHV